MDPLVSVIQVVRTVVGLAAVLWAVFAYQLVDDLREVVDERLTQSWISLVLLSVAFPVTLMVLVLAAHRSVRRVLSRRMLRPLGALLALVASIALFPLLNEVNVLEVRNPLLAVLMLPVGLVGTLVVVLWVLPFFLYGAVMCLVHVFRTADVHETVPSILMTVIVWLVSLIDLVTGAYEGAPLLVQLALIFGGPVSVTGVAVWELWRLRTRHGVTLRGALGR